MYTVKKNISISIIAQVISMICGFVLQLLIPKFIDVQQYAYWQTFVLYANYVGILHFGLLDGFVLRYSQYDYAELDKPKLRGQFLLLLLLLSFVSFVSIVVGVNLFDNEYRQVLVLVAVSIVIKNVFTYASYSFQITNQIKNYALQIIIQRSSYLVGVLLLIVGDVNDFFWFCFVELLGEFISICYSFKNIPDLFIGKILSLVSIFDEIKLNLFAGAMLMVANWTGNFSIALMRIIIQQKWGLLTFGQVSFCFSVMQIFLAFIIAASIALFPSIKRMNAEELPNLYVKIRDVSSPMLLCCMLFYFPVVYILNIWLPKYHLSLIYLGALLPYILFSTKLTLLTNTYLKAYRKEKIMMLINVGSLLGAAICFYVSAFVVNSMNAVLYCMIIVMFIRSFLSEIVVEKIIIKTNYFLKAEEFFFSILFIVITTNFSLVDGFCAYGVIVLMLFAIHRNELKKILNCLH